MRLLPRLRRKDPVEEEISNRKAALQEKRARRNKTRRRVATPLARLNPNEIPPDAVVFTRTPIAAEPFEEPVTTTDDQPIDVELAADDQLDVPPDFLRKEPDAEAPAAETPATEPANELAGLAEPEQKPAADALGGDMLDLFREEKQSDADGSLASQVEDISIEDLLADIGSITERLGVPKRDPYVHEVHIEPEITDEETAAEPEPEVKVEKIEPRAVAVALEPVPEVIAGPVEEIDIGSLLEPEPQADSEPPDGLPPATETRFAPPPAYRKRGVDGSMMMHLLFLGLAVTAAGAFGLTRINRPHTADAENDPSRIVLAVVTTPKPTFGAAGTKAPTPSPSPEPTASPTPEPTRRARLADVPPAFQDYQVEYGDSLWSISRGFGLCPDHLLWANGRDEETPLIAGEYLTIPDGVGIVHRVRSGDTLSSISRQYNADIASITAVEGNQLSTSADLIPGTKIFIPDGIPQSALDLGSKALKKMTKPSSSGYVWPFYGPITTYYGEQRVGYVHNAVDIGGLGHYGASVNSMADGRVAFAGYDDIYGNNVIVLHPDGSRSRYAHLSKVYVAQGETVSRGQALGALGCSGDSTGTHLHFELWKDDEPVDPLIYLP